MDADFLIDAWQRAETEKMEVVFMKKIKQVKESKTELKLLSLACQLYDERGDYYMEALTEAGDTICIKIEHTELLEP